MLRRLVEKEVNGDIKIQFLQTPGDEVVVGKRDLRVKTNTEQTADLTVIDATKHFVAVNSGLRQLIGIDTPNARNVGPVFRVADIARSGQLVAFLSMLSATLAVGLAGDRCVAASFASNSS